MTLFLPLKRRIYNNDENLSGTITSAGGTTIVKDGSSRAKYLKGLTAGTGITLTPGTNDVTITNSSTGDAVTLSNGGAGTSLVQDGVGPALATKSITAGSGITFTDSATNTTIDTAAPTSIGANASATANSLTLSANVLKAAVAGPTLPGVIRGNTSTGTNTSIGHSAMNNYLGISGTNNTGFGYNCMGSLSTGTDNTCVGKDAGSTGSSIQSGTYNTIVGSLSGVNSTSASDRGVFGYNASSTANGTLVFASQYSAMTATGWNAMTIGTGLGTTASAANLYYNNANGQILRSTSSVTTKSNIRPANYDTSKLFLLQLKQYDQNWVGEQFKAPGSVIGCDYCELKKAKDLGQYNEEFVTTHYLVIDKQATKVSKEEYEENAKNNDINWLIETKKMVGDICVTGLDEKYLGVDCPHHRGEKIEQKLGFIAEDFESIGLPELVQKNDKGEVMGIEYNCLIACLFNEVKKLRNELYLAVEEINKIKQT